MRKKAPRGHWPPWVLLVPLILLGMVLFRSFLPQAKAILPGCVLYESTGVLCPGCGGTRAAEALVLLDFGLAIRQNAWAVTALILGVPFLFLSALRVRFPQVGGLRFFRWQGWMLWPLLASIGLFAILRNFPAFDWLAPVAQ